MGGGAAEVTAGFWRDSAWRASTILERMQTHPLWDSAAGQQLEGHQLHTGSWWSDWKWGGCWANLQKLGSDSDPSLNPPPRGATKWWNWLPQPGDYLRLLPTQFTGSFYRVKAAPPIHKNKHREAAKSRRQRNTAQRKEQNKTPEKELNEMEMANLSDAEFKHWWPGCSKNSLSTATT